LPEGVNVQRATRADVLDPTTHLRRAGARVRAPEVDVALLHRPQRRAALGALGGHDEGPLAAVAALRDRPEDLGNDVTGLAAHHRVPDEYPLGLDDLLVVERGLPHRASRDVDGLHDGVRGGAAGTPDPDADVEQARVDLLGRVLVGDRPAGCAARLA